jgi:hypothetical protein
MFARKTNRELWNIGAEGTKKTSSESRSSFLEILYGPPTENRVTLAGFVTRYGVFICPRTLGDPALRSGGYHNFWPDLSAARTIPSATTPPGEPVREQTRGETTSTYSRAGREEGEKKKGGEQS